MKKDIIAAALGLGLLLFPVTGEAGGKHSSHSSSVSASKKTEHVSGYRRKDGKWVKPYNRRPAGEAQGHTRKRK